MKGTLMLNDPVLLNDWHVVAYASELKEGKPMAVRLLEEDIVLWRVGDKIHAWRDLCLHRGTRLSLGKVEEETLICPYHGWTYNEEGQCIRFPAHPDQVPPVKARVKVYQAQEKYNWIWVTLGNPVKDIPTFPQWDDASFHKVHCGPYQYNASGPRALENLLDQNSLCILPSPRWRSAPRLPGPTWQRTTRIFLMKRQGSLKI